MSYRNTWSSTILCVAIGIGPVGAADTGQSTSSFLDDIIAKVEAAKTRYEHAKRVHDGVKGDVERTRAGKRLADAEHEYAASMDELDRARIRVLADKSGLAPEEIAAMRAGGKGWGAIAGELGVHPGVLGRGHMAKVPRGTAALSSDPVAKGKGKDKGKRKKQKDTKD